MNCHWETYDKGGPLFFEQYTFQGIDPNGLKDSLALIISSR